MFLKKLFAKRVSHDTPFVLACLRYLGSRNNIEDATDDSTVQGFKHREIGLMNKNTWRKNKENLSKRRN